MASTPFGRKMRDKHFLFDSSYVPLNHGSYGAFPAVVRDHQRSLQDRTEARSDDFIRRQAPRLLLEARSAVAKLLHVPRQNVVFVPNATTGINTVLRNLTWEAGDVIIYFSTAYPACENTILHLCETTPATWARIDIRFPIEDDDLVRVFQHMIQNLVSEHGKRVKLAMFDTVCTYPGVHLPWEALVAVCKMEGILSLVDGAHGVGHIDLSHLERVDPDFFTSNCYKWLYTPRPCAILYVPKRLHHLIRTTLPTSHGFKPMADSSSTSPHASGYDRLGELFAWVATVDMSPYLSVPAALKFREEVCGGETAIRNYCIDLAQQGGKRMAEILATDLMDNQTSSSSRCCFTMVRLPLTFSVDANGGHDGGGKVHFEANGDSAKHDEMPRFHPDQAPGFVKRIMDKLRDTYDTWIPVDFYNGALWARVSAQVYLELADFEWAAGALSALCNEIKDSAVG